MSHRDVVLEWWCDCLVRGSISPDGTEKTMGWRTSPILMVVDGLFKLFSEYAVKHQHGAIREKRFWDTLRSVAPVTKLNRKKGGRTMPVMVLDLSSCKRMVEETCLPPGNDWETVFPDSPV